MSEEITNYVELKGINKTFDDYKVKNKKVSLQAVLVKVERWRFSKKILPSTLTNDLMI